MKRAFLLSVFLLCASFLFAQYPSKQTLGSDSTLVQSKGALKGRIINWSYPDTASANLEEISHYPGAQITVGLHLYIRSQDTTRWNISQQGSSNVSILNDSSILVCNLNGCDTFKVSVQPANFTITSDTTIRVCDASGACDTVYTSPTSFIKSFVDSVIIHNGANLDTLYYYINGNAIVGGYIGGRYYNKNQIDSIFTVTLQNYYTQTQIDSINTVGNNESNHIISGGVVTWSGTGLTYYISGCTYLIGGVVYNSPDTTITLDAADATNPRIDLFAVDTLGRALKITGVAASTPLTPQVDPNSQLPLTTGISLTANETTPTATSILIYDENVEWTTGGTSTTNYNNTTNPYHGTKDALVSYTKNQTLTFSGTTQTVNGQVLRAFIYLNNSNYNFQFQFYNGTTAVSNLLTLNGFGFNPTLYNVYQNVSIPLTAFTWSGTSFDKLAITMTGKGATGTYYLDYVSLEGGTPIPPQIDYSNKVDSVKMRNDSIFYVIKGVYYYSGFNAYQRSQTDSITAQLRSEIVSAAGGGVISFNGRNGAVVPDSTDYYDFYYTRHLIDSLLGLKENISDAFSGSYNDLTDKPVTVTNLSLGTVTSTSQAINNSNGTGVVLPSASITTAGLMTAGDKVLVNTISGKVNYTDTASMLSPYLRKIDAFTKSQADLLYKPITYVPSWSEITGKPTIPAAQIQSDWNQTDNAQLDYIKNKPTIPTNNNELTNGAGYITGLDTMSLIHTYDSTLYTTPYQSGLKVDSVTRISNSYYYWTKGVKHLISLATDSTAYHTIGQASDYFTLNTLDGRKDTVSFPKDTQYVKNPLYSDNDTLKFHSDSLTSVLKYSGIDSSAYDDNTLIPKGYLNDRIAEVTATGITRSELQDTAIAIRSAIPLQFNPIAGANVTLSGIYPNITFNSTASGATNSNIGSGYRLAVPFTNNIKTIFAVSPLGIDSVSNSNALTFTFDTSLYHSTAWNNVNYGSLSQQNTNTSNIASNTTAIAGKLSNITGLVTPGTNVIVAGSGTSGSPYVISSTGGGTSQLDWYYPESYGAKADSSTLNARAFQAMIDAMPVRGGKVHLSSGVYLFGDTTIRIDKPIMFEGNGMVDALNKVTTLITTYNRAMFNVVEDNVTFKDLTINDLQSSTPTSGSVGIKADSNYRSHQYIVGLTLQNVTVNGFFNNVEATGTVFFRFSNCRFSGIFNYGVDVANRFIPDAGDSYITGCTFLPSSSNAVAAIHQLNSGGLRITNCKFNWHTTTGWFNYNYLADSISGTSDLFTGMSSLENYKVSAIKIKKLPTGSFSLVNINNNEFGDFQNATAPAIDINGISNINIVGNTFSKGTIDTAIKMTSVTSSNILGNTYSSSYGVPVYYSGTNTNISGEGVALGTKNLLAKFTDSVHIGNSVFQDSSSVAAINLRAVTGGYVPNYISDGSIGQSKLSIVSSANSGTSEVSFINSNTAGLGGFSLWKQTGATSSTNLLTIKANGNSGFGGIVSPVAYVDIPAGTGSGSTGQIHLAPGKATNSDGYLSYDTAIGGKHLYFNIGGTQYRLDSQVVSGGGGTPLLADGSVPLTANWNVGNHNITAIASLSATTISAGSSITSNNTISANGAVSGTSFTSTQFNGGSGTLTGLLLRDFSQATSSVTAQNSLMAVWQGYVWNGTASQEVDYRAGVFPIGGTSTSEWKLSTSLAAGAYSDVLKVKNDGRVTLSNVINLKAYTVATLPTGTVGDVAYVTDASSPTALATVSGGGSTTVMVFYNGTNWIVP